VLIQVCFPVEIYHEMVVPDGSTPNEIFDIVYAQQTELGNVIAQTVDRDYVEMVTPEWEILEEEDEFSEGLED